MNLAERFMAAFAGFGAHMDRHKYQMNDELENKRQSPTLFGSL